ncbi:alpha/beta hydrolase, partial [Streptomyces sp. NPDC002537]
MTAAAEESALQALPYVPPDGTVAYGDHPSQVIDLYRPARPTGTRVTLLHGGFWREAYDRRHLAPLAAALAARGAEVALVEYRRVGGGGGLPATFDDVAAALAIPLPGATGRHVLVGHSAGGHLALWAASAAPGGLARVVAVAPLADLALASELRLSDGAVAEFLGADDGRVAGVDPARMPGVRVPVVVLHGAADADVPVEVSRRYVAAMGDAAALHVLPGVGHYAAVTPGSCAYGALLAALGGAGPLR